MVVLLIEVILHGRWCSLLTSLVASTHHPPCEQWLTGLGGTNDVSFVPVLGAKAHLPSQLSFSGMVAELLARNQQKCSHHMLGAAQVMRQSLVNLHFLERGRGGCAKAVGQPDSQTVGQTWIQGTDFLNATSSSTSYTHDPHTVSKAEAQSYYAGLPSELYRTGKEQ
ncbi:hypothetical protein L208DRAFT_1411624, partial [Tricholoma matsutake]